MNKLLKTTLVSIAALTTVACITATIADNSVCDTQSVSFAVPTLPTLPANIGCEDVPAVSIPTFSTTTTVDFSKDLAKVDDAGIVSALTISINKLVLDNSAGDLDWVKSIFVQIQSGSLPTTELASYTSTGVAVSDINVSVVMPASELITYLKTGPANLTILLSADTVNACEVQKLASMSAVGSSAELCVSASVSVKK
jgi:hypothetical protein